MKRKGFLPLLLVAALLVAYAPLAGGRAAAGEGTYPCRAEKAGYYALHMRYRSPGPRNQRMSLFVNGRFAKTLRFEGVPEGAAGEAEAPVYLPEGLSEISLRSGPGDGRVEIDGMETAPCRGETKLIVVPHEDDEVFAFGGVIQSLLENGDDVRVLLLTNGDFFGLELGPERILESVYALDRLGLPQENLFVFGYPDTGLAALLDAEDGNEVQSFSFGAKETYGNPAIPLYDYHTMQTGAPAALTGGNLRGDMECLLEALMPSEIYTTSVHDRHSDHSAAYRLVEGAVLALKRRTGYAPLLHESVVHGQKHSWPERLAWTEEEEPVCEPFSNPFPGGGVPLDWRKATKIQLTEDMRERKYEAIGEYYTQNVLFDGEEYDYSYYKTDEFYWTRDFSLE